MFNRVLFICINEDTRVCPCVVAHCNVSADKGFVERFAFFVVLHFFSAFQELFVDFGSFEAAQQSLETALLMMTNSKMVESDLADTAEDINEVRWLPGDPFLLRSSFAPLCAKRRRCSTAQFVKTTVDTSSFFLDSLDAASRSFATPGRYGY